MVGGEIIVDFDLNIFLHFQTIYYKHLLVSDFKKL